jgi:hypothetical protein
MPFVLLFIGATLIVSGVRGTSGTLFTLLKGDFTGNGNFLYWFLAVLIIGSIGYVKKLQTFSDIFLGLLVLVMIIANEKTGKDFFSSFDFQISNPLTPKTTASTMDAKGPGGGGGLSGNSQVQKTMGDYLSNYYNNSNSSSGSSGSTDTTTGTTTGEAYSYSAG